MLPKARRRSAASSIVMGRGGRAAAEGGSEPSLRRTAVIARLTRDGAGGAGAACSMARRGGPRCVSAGRRTARCRWRHRVPTVESPNPSSFSRRRASHRIPTGRGDSRAVCPSQNWLPLHRAQAGPKRHRSGHGRPLPMPVRCCFAVANSCRETPARNASRSAAANQRNECVRDSCNRVARCERRQRGHLPGLAGADGAQPCSPYP